MACVAISRWSDRRFLSPSQQLDVVYECDEMCLIKLTANRASMEVATAWYGCSDCGSALPNHPSCITSRTRGRPEALIGPVNVISG